jgi:hypothetical protein
VKSYVRKMIQPLICVAFFIGFANARPDLVPIFDARLQLKPGAATQIEASTITREALPKARAFWKKQGADCTTNNGEGERYFKVQDVTTGAFTRKGTRQRAVLYLYCLASPVDPAQTYSGVAILEAGRLVQNIPIQGNHYAIGALPDLNGDGLLEIITVSGFSMQGGISESHIAVFDLPRGGTRDLLDLKTDDSNCGSMGEEPNPYHNKAVKVYAQRGKRIRFFAEVFNDTNACRENTKPNWQKISPLKPLRGKDSFEVLPAN